jgi:hypothetical protein
MITFIHRVDFSHLSRSCHHLCQMSGVIIDAPSVRITIIDHVNSCCGWWRPNGDPSQYNGCVADQTVYFPLFLAYFPRLKFPHASPLTHSRLRFTARSTVDVKTMSSSSYYLTIILQIDLGILRRTYRGIFAFAPSMFWPLTNGQGWDLPKMPSGRLPWTRRHFENQGSMVLV